MLARRRRRNNQPRAKVPPLHAGNGGVYRALRRQAIAIHLVKGSDARADPLVHSIQLGQLLCQSRICSQSIRNLASIRFRQLAGQVEQQNRVVIGQCVYHGLYHSCRASKSAFAHLTVTFKLPYCSINCLSLIIALCIRPRAVFSGHPTISAISTNFRSL